jgi:DNA-damage-inducible protein J
MNTTMQIRIDQPTKAKAQKAFKSMGIDLSSGVKMFLHQVAIDQCMPFVPSTKKTQAIRKQWDKEYEWVMKHGKGYTSAEEMHEAIMKNR